MPFKKGQSGNPKGRPVSAGIDDLRRAIKIVEGRKKKKFLIHAVQEAYTDNKVLVAILKKIIPDLKYIENEHSTNESTMAMVVKAIQGMKSGKT